MLGMALASAGVSLLSGLFGRSSAKKQAKKEEQAIAAANKAATEQADTMNAQIRARADAAALVPVMTERESQSYVDMDGFMSAAEDYGFNPLTFLRSGALASFTHTHDWTCTTGERAMDAALSGTYLPSLSPVISGTKVPGVGDVFGNALQAGFNQFAGDFSQQQQNLFQMDLLKARLAGQNANGAYSNRNFNVPWAHTTGPNSGAKSSGQTCIAGMCWAHDGSTTDAQDVENRYGELADWAWGLVAGGADVAKALGIQAPSVTIGGGPTYTPTYIAKRIQDSFKGRPPTVGDFTDLFKNWPSPF